MDAHQIDPLEPAGVPQGVPKDPWGPMQNPRLIAIGRVLKAIN